MMKTTHRSFFIRHRIQLLTSFMVILSAVLTIPGTVYFKSRVAAVNKAEPAISQSSCIITGSNGRYGSCGFEDFYFQAPAGNYFYLWTIVSGNATIIGPDYEQEAQVWTSPTETFTVMLTLTNKDDGSKTTCTKTVTNGAPPTCSITGEDYACAGSSNNIYTGPAGADLTYQWSISGNGTIVGPTTGQSVMVNAGASGSFTLSLAVKNSVNSCSSTCTKIVTIDLPCMIIAPEKVCSTTGYTFSGPAGANLAYQWSISGSGTIAGSTTGQNVTIMTGDPGQITLTLMVTNTVTGCSNTCTQTFTVNNCNPKGPGIPFRSTSEISDQRPGSILIYNIYTSSIAAPNTQNTRINLTNGSQNMSVAVHLFFVDGASCSVADSFVCLTPNQTSSFLASDIDPGATGYIVAVATDCATGCPINYNCLIGDEYVKFASGHEANLPAEAIGAMPEMPVLCDANSVTAAINFDGISYNQLPRTLAAGNIGSRADGNDTMLIVNRIGGNLGIGASSLGAMFGIFYDDAENAASFSFTGGCQFRSSISNNFPRITPRFENFVPAGRSGWFKLWVPGENDNKGILGALINFNPNSGASPGAFSQGHNLHKLKMDTFNSFVVPVFPPSCCR